MFWTSIVHLQERSYAVCCNLVCLDTLWGWRKNCSSSFTLTTTGRIETYQIATYSIRTLLKMDYWIPKHVELLNVMNKINHQILCILLDYRYIAKWYTVHTISNSEITFIKSLAFDQRNKYDLKRVTKPWAQESLSFRIRGDGLLAYEVASFYVSAVFTWHVLEKQLVCTASNLQGCRFSHCSYHDKSCNL